MRILFLILFVASSAFSARLKDIAEIEGVRDNQLVGYGVVVGLNGTGDGGNSLFTRQSISNMLERLDIRVPPDQLNLSNTAGVFVTATLPPFAKKGSELDITISSLGDAASLQGGVLLMTPLKGADGQVYAVGQGSVTVGGFAVASGGDSAQQNHPTVGRIPSGAIIEREIPFDLFAEGTVRVVLNQPDFRTITRVRDAINTHLGGEFGEVFDSGSVKLSLGELANDDPIKLIAELEDLTVTPDLPARVVVNERTGTIIIGENVKVEKVALAHGNLNIVIREEQQVVQPPPFAQGETAVVPNEDITVTQEPANLSLLGGDVELSDVVAGLNALGATPRDMIAIFQALKTAGALNAELVIM